MQHYIRFDVRPCNNRKWPNILAISYWRAYTKKW